MAVTRAPDRTSSLVRNVPINPEEPSTATFRSLLIVSDRQVQHTNQLMSQLIPGEFAHHSFVRRFAEQLPQVLVP